MSASTRYCGTDVIFSFEIQRQTRSFFCLCYGVLQIFSQIFSSFENLKDYRRCLHPNLLGAGYGREINSCLSGWQASILSCGRNYFSMVLILLLVMGLCQFVISYGFDFTPKFVREVCLSIISNHRLCRQVHDMISAYVGQSLLPCYNFLRALGNLELQ